MHLARELLMTYSEMMIQEVYKEDENLEDEENRAGRQKLRTTS